MTLEELVQRVNEAPVRAPYKASKQHTDLQRTWPSKHEYDFGTLVEDVAAHLDGLDVAAMKPAFHVISQNVERDRLSAFNRRLSLNEHYMAVMRRYHKFKHPEASL